MNKNIFPFQLFGVVFMATLLLGGPPSYAKKQTLELTEIDAALACNAAIKAVKAKLKAPASAQFPSCWAWDANKFEMRIAADGKKMSVKSYVDAQNSFGALIRNTWIVIFTKDGNNLTVKTVAIGQ